LGNAHRQQEDSGQVAMAPHGLLSIRNHGFHRTVYIGTIDGFLN